MPDLKFNSSRMAKHSENNFSAFVSIIVPAFNESKVLKQSLQSLLDLNYWEYEIIIVNDGSTDNTREIAESFVGYRQGKFNEIKITLINKENGGKSYDNRTKIVWKSYNNRTIIVQLAYDNRTA